MEKADLWNVEFVIDFRVDRGDEVEELFHFVGLDFSVVVCPFDLLFVGFFEQVVGETDVAMAIVTLLFIYQMLLDFILEKVEIQIGVLLW